MESAVTNIKSRKEDVKITKDKSLETLNRIFCKLHDALDERKKQLSEQLIQDSTEKSNRLQGQENELCALLEKLKSCSL